MSYTVVEGNGLGKLIAAVNEYIKRGWKPIGGVAVGAVVGWYFQAMIRD